MTRLFNQPTGFADDVLTGLVDAYPARLQRVFGGVVRATASPSGQVAVVIGGGYATGRELAEFFLPSGPWGGLAAMLLAMLLWSIICATSSRWSAAT